MKAKTAKKEPKCLLDRLNDALEKADAMGVSRESALRMVFAMEMQILENRIVALENKK